MLSSIRSRHRFILASVKFLSRALTALNSEPSMATLATLTNCESLPGADRDNVHVQAGCGFENRQNVIEQA
jgi:hypothetical protein